MFQNCPKSPHSTVPCFKRHCSSKQGLHVATSLLFNSFIDNMSGARRSIDTFIVQNLQKSNNDNRQKLISIIDTMILCGQIGIPLRGHRDGERNAFFPDKAADCSNKKQMSLVLRFVDSNCDIRKKNFKIYLL